MPLHGPIIGKLFGLGFCKIPDTVHKVSPGGIVPYLAQHTYKACGAIMRPILTKETSIWNLLWNKVKITVA